jgi:hypothetical protein
MIMVAVGSLFARGCGLAWLVDAAKLLIIMGD